MQQSLSDTKTAPYIIIRTIKIKKMKHYFGFNLTGRKLLPVWLTFYAFFIIPYVLIVIKLENIQPGENPPVFIFPSVIGLIIIAFLLTFYIAKLIIEHINYKEEAIIFNGSFARFARTILFGLFLSIITLGIYMAWFIRDLHRFFVDNSAYNSNTFKFNGRGGKLFVILLLSLYLPIILLTIVMTKILMGNTGQIDSSIVYVQQLIMWIIMIPYMYYVYKWMIDIDYKGYNISWETNFWNSCGKIAIEILLSIITLGIYMPMAMLKLYKYFTDKTFAKSGDIKRRFGFDSDNMNDFLFIWGQLLLTIISLGIYYPWSISKVGNRLMSKTYLE